MLDSISTRWKVDLIVIRRETAIQSVIHEHVLILLLHVLGAPLIELIIYDVRIFPLVARVAVSIGDEAWLSRVVLLELVTDESSLEDFATVKGALGKTLVINLGTFATDSGW